MQEDGKRFTDDLIIKHVQKFEDFIDRYERDQIDSKIWRINIEKEMQPLKEFIRNATWSYKLVLCMAALIGVLAKTLIYFRDHFKWF